MIENVATGQDGNVVIGLYSEWGTGKTYFLHQWMHKLKEEGKPHVYLNAFERDYQSDAFLAISGMLAEVYANHAPDEQANFLTTAARLGKIVGLSAGNIAIKAATAGIVDITAGDGALDAAIEQLGDEASKHLANAIAQSAKQDAAMKELRDTLAELPTLLGKDDKLAPLIFIVDELDRCKPTFAIQLLEVIKHFFNVPGISFVLSANPRALSVSIEQTYGPIDGSAYLGRFVNLAFWIKKVNLKGRHEDLEKYIEFKWLEHSVPDRHNDVKEAFIGFTAALATHFDLSLREVDRILTVLFSSLFVLQKNNPRPAAIFVALIFARVLEPTLYANLSSAEASYKVFSDWLGDVRYDTPYERHMKHLQEVMNAILAYDPNNERHDEIVRSFTRYHLFDDRILKVLSDRFLEDIWLPDSEFEATG